VNVSTIRFRLCCNSDQLEVGSILSILTPVCSVLNKFYVTFGTDAPMFSVFTRQSLGVGPSLIKIIWICEAKNSLKFASFGNLSYQAFKFVGFSNVSMKEKVLHDRMAILVELCDCLFINTESKIQVIHLRRLDLISWIFSYFVDFLYPNHLR